ncbi:MAG: hypothetical protein ACF8AM_09875 [Rhodopirellula sp. JB055]|uniref:hypothetical protein n=1 Tax=Rhodopirellula sp. JB055 TaxID=3342846 RepID=UPI00370B8B44
MFLPLLAWLSIGSLPAIIIAAGIGIVVGILSWTAPKLISPLFIGLMLITFPIGIVLGELVMLVIYMSVFLPMGIAFRLFGRDRLQRRIDRNCKSYWSPKKQPKSAASYYRQS